MYEADRSLFNGLNMKKKVSSQRKGVLAGGNWIVDQVKIIDILPQRDKLANILDQAQGTGGSPYNLLVNLSRLALPFLSWPPVWWARMQ